MSSLTSRIIKPTLFLRGSVGYQTEDHKHQASGQPSGGLPKRARSSTQAARDSERRCRSGLESPGCRELRGDTTGVRAGRAGSSCPLRPATGSQINVPGKIVGRADPSCERNATEWERRRIRHAGRHGTNGSIVHWPCGCSAEGPSRCVNSERPNGVGHASKGCEPKSRCSTHYAVSARCLDRNRCGSRGFSRCEGCIRGRMTKALADTAAAFFEFKPGRAAHRTASQALMNPVQCTVRKRCDLVASGLPLSW